jgi:hypothetical protein
VNPWVLYKTTFLDWRGLDIHVAVSVSNQLHDKGKKSMETIAAMQEWSHVNAIFHQLEVQSNPIENPKPL